MLLIAAISFAVWYIIPREIHRSLDGIKYRLGEENREFEELITVNIDGRMNRNWKGERIFTGSILVEGEEISVPPDQRELEVRFPKNSYHQLIIYHGIHNSSIYQFPYGDLFTNEDLSELTITRFEETPSGIKGWDSEDGLMISAPAEDRAEALEISNRYFKAYWMGMTKPLE
ncbi:hypothetical protein ACK8P5_17005 [Paenibacillus sp. EC2-1]|uniref:hypothetical protein n=1 Tax=Paenibacillus sp. EC2-1 TaxID=3388665 RepID=UPI003BEED6C0